MITTEQAQTVKARAQQIFDTREACRFCGGALYRVDIFYTCNTLRTWKMLHVVALCKACGNDPDLTTKKLGMEFDAIQNMEVNA